MTEDGKDAPEVVFLVEEYKNIAGTHDKLRDIVSRHFNYFLLLSAFPFTVAGIMFRSGGFDLWDPPAGLRPLFCLVGLGHLFLTLGLVDARLSQYRYAKTVNLIRKYFVEKTPGLSNYLYLPTEVQVPRWENLGFIEYQVWFMVIIGTLFVGYGCMGLAGGGKGIAMGLLAMAAYVGSYWYFRASAVKGYKAHRGVG